MKLLQHNCLASVSIFVFTTIENFVYLLQKRGKINLNDLVLQRETNRKFNHKGFNIKYQHYNLL